MFRASKFIVFIDSANATAATLYRATANAREADQSKIWAWASGLRASSSLLGPWSLLSSYILALLAWSVQAYILYVILVSLGLPIVDYIAVGIFAAGLLAGALSFISGGQGSTEAVIILLLARSGVSTPDAVAATLLCRVATLWFAVASRSASLFAIELKRRGEKAVAVSANAIFKPASKVE